MSSPELTSRANTLRRLIYEYIDEQFQEKVKSLEVGTDAYIKQQEKYQPNNWLAETMKRIAGIQVVTHPFRMTNSQVNIRHASSFYCNPDELLEQNYVTSHVLKNGYLDDLTGNAASFPAYTFLQLEHEGQTLLQMAVRKDQDLISALHEDKELAALWVKDISEIYLPRTESVASHTSGKQIFWNNGEDPYDNDNYILLAPLYSSSLSYELYKKISHDRYSEEAVKAREAARANKIHDGVARDYRNLAVLKLGGSNTQNVSRLNNLMGGQNYLLPSLPPSWKSRNQRPPLKVSSIFSLFEKRRDTKQWLDELKEFLSNQPPANKHTRNKVDLLVSGLLDELYIFVTAFQELPAGWSKDELCDLSSAQCYWLDPARGLEDEEFAESWLNSDWDVTVEHDFARWLNHQLGSKVKHLGDVEFRRWAREMRKDSYWQRFISGSLKALQKQHVRREG
ncbi:type I-F CRISPR-associated protein Csy1 [Parahaliea sp. F7430]|uniref:Type I-F CRISPR-associated protein Csy1 n=1 Tax=Sediminihaliea albiluteola TaxID=2758564 RepID=A0A7W2YIH1_9GAMM|nr:type I-F CRISPR-associated protein Csy1 [Sediminihaliea albiluteola]MBA6412057.1 type I-F CRISPR-associated protein Csy1 [Sediminihaliea albiluteola]